MTPAEAKRALRQRYRARGLCWLGPHPTLPGSALCQAHLDAQRERARRRSGYQPWEPGRRGHPPIARPA